MNNVRMKLKVLTTANMKTAVFCDVAPCRLIQTDYYEGSSETSVTFYDTTLRNIPENSLQ